ncbi:AAA family ATPase [Virgisporangium ochraceum]|uniref:Transcriptional regulator n=1 Tax=Virgisporangium ochraceum TaxID=65505 RepID=A0A8J4ECP0_9ACTN|nr:LuxR family transcriptional regulator [Virgisporangium ochraceum]GIJ67092.1 transcriptional regulator [Virgisporangium ochraceum]
MQELVGRDVELAAVAGFLDGAARVLLVEGEAGVGKSALVNAAMGPAAARGWRVRVSRPTENEARFAYAGLADLLGPDTDTDTARLPPPQRHALAVALRRADPAAALDPHAVMLATIGVLTAGRTPVLLVVDDVPWLDTATSAVLAAVVRRVPGDRVRLLLARRTPGAVTGTAAETTPPHPDPHLEPEPDGMPWQLDRHLPSGACQRLRVTGLAEGDLHEVLRRRLGRRLPRAVVRRVHAVSRGNPFYALHLARAPHGEESLTALIAAGLDAVPAADRDVLLLAAALAVPRLDRLRRAVPGADAAVERAEAAGILTVHADGRFGFDHPLTASMLHQTATAPDRRAAHRRLAEVEPEPEARARHLALGTLGPDDRVAAQLAEAARDARLRGASDVAAELMSMAVDRGTRPCPEWTVALGEYLLDAGDPDAACEVLDRVLPTLPPDALRARAGYVRGTASWFTGRPDGTAHLRDAVDAAADDPQLRGRILFRLAMFSDDDLVSAARYAGESVRALEDAGATDPLAGALCALFYNEVLLGGEPRTDLLDRAVALESPDGDPDHSSVPGIWFLALDRWAEAEQRFRTNLERDRSRGELFSEPDLLLKLAEVALWADDWAAARERADAAVRSARQLGDAAADPSVRHRLFIDAHEGDVVAAGTAARKRAEELTTAGEPMLAVAYLAVAGFAAASAGDTGCVLDVTAMAARHLAAIGIVEPIGRLDATAERMEALVLAGRLDEAERLLGEVRVRLDRIPRPWLEAAWRRAAAELAAARGDLAGAVERAVPPPGARTFDRARMLLTRGRLLRRARRPGAAGEALAEAAEIFERLGARAWSARVEAERSRLGLRRAGGDGLTPTELRIARLAAAGRTNRAVAGELTISPKTVEAHLARIYRKLGIRSRAELGSLLGSGRLPAGDP